MKPPINFAPKLNVCFFLALVSLYIFKIKSYLLGNQFIFHDNLPYLSDSILLNTGKLPSVPRLRSIHQTLGVPTWMNSEIRIGFDPINILFGNISRTFQINILQVEAWRIAALFVFCVYCIWQISIQLKLHPLAQFLIILLLLQSPLSFGLWGQAAGLLMPFKYVPITILLILKFFQSKKTYLAILSLASFLLSIQSYQGIYALTFYIMLMFCFLNVPRLRYLLSFILHNSTLFITFICTAVLLVLPLGIALLEVRQKFFILPREVFKVPYSTELNFSELDYVFGEKQIFNPWHGGLWVGYFPFLLILIGIVLSFLIAKNKIEPSSLNLNQSHQFLRLSVLNAMVLYLTIDSPVPFARLSSSVIDAPNTFLGARNWGFLSSIFNCLTIFIAGIALHLSIVFIQNKSKFRILKSLSLLISLIFLAIDLSRLPIQAREVDVLSSLWMPKDRIESLNLENFSNLSRIQSARDFMFYPQKYFPFTAEGASIWGKSTLNYKDTYSDYQSWKVIPTTTLTHSYEYLDFRKSKDFQVFADENTWRESRFSTDFYLSTNSVCIKSDAYSNGKDLNDLITYIDVIATDTTPIPTCNSKLPKSNSLPKVALLYSDNTRKTFSVQTREYGFLILNENFDSNFRAQTSEGIRLKVFPANLRGLAIPLEPGKYELRLDYFPVLYIQTFLLRLFAFLFLLIGLAFAYARRSQFEF